MGKDTYQPPNAGMRNAVDRPDLVATIEIKGRYIKEGDFKLSKVQTLPVDLSVAELAHILVRLCTLIIMDYFYAKSRTYEQWDKYRLAIRKHFGGQDDGQKSN